jgi:hypothetical protein
LNFSFYEKSKSQGGLKDTREPRVGFELLEFNDCG